MLTSTACTPAPKETTIADPGTSVSGTVELWHFFTEREAAAIDQVVKEGSVTRTPSDRRVRRQNRLAWIARHSIAIGHGPADHHFLLRPARFVQGITLTGFNG